MDIIYQRRVTSHIRTRSVSLYTAFNTGALGAKKSARGFREREVAVSRINTRPIEADCEL